MYSVRDSVKRISEGFSERFSHRFTERFSERFSKRCSERHSERHSERFSETLHVHFIIFGVDAGVIFSCEHQGDFSPVSKQDVLEVLNPSK